MNKTVGVLGCTLCVHSRIASYHVDDVHLIGTCPGVVTLVSLPTPAVVAAGVGRAFSRVCLSVCVFVCRIHNRSCEKITAEEGLLYTKMYTSFQCRCRSEIADSAPPTRACLNLCAIQFCNNNNNNLTKLTRSNSHLKASTLAASVAVSGS